MSYYDIKMSYPDIIMPHAENMPDPVISMTISNTMPYCDIILPYPTGLVILMAYCHAKCWYCRHPPPTPQLMTPNSYVHNVNITPHIDIMMLFFALLSHILTL